jgi:ribulose-phosphate 3-epimerase
MSVIAPAILVDTPEAYKASVDRYHPFAQRVHIDLSDGEFAPSFTVGIDQLWWPQEWSVDIHAMVARPMEYIEQLVALKPHTIIFHVEAVADIAPILKRVKQAGVRAGVALQRPTVPSTVEAAIKEADHVMVFTGNLGQYGGTASLMQLEKVRLIKAINPNVEIGWDGGVNVDNAYTLTQGGVDVLNVGGAIANAAEPGQVYATLVSEINKHGVI